MRHPQGLLAGMLWFDPDKPDALSNIRHPALESDSRVQSCHIALQQLDLSSAVNMYRCPPGYAWPTDFCMSPGSR